jgi:hypothetical protein
MSGDVFAMKLARRNPRIKWGVKVTEWPFRWDEAGEVASNGNEVILVVLDACEESPDEERFEPGPSIVKLKVRHAIHFVLKYVEEADPVS